MFLPFLRAISGIIIILIFAWLFSPQKKKVSPRIIIAGLGLQLLLAFLVLKVPHVQQFFEWISLAFVKILGFAKEGSRFLFGELVDEKKYGVIFAFQVLPTIIFFSALTSVLYFFGIIQFLVKIFAKIIRKILPVSGPEAIAVSSNIFLGQIEAALLVKAYLPKMNPSGIFLIMTSGMATIAGGVLLFYITFLGGTDTASQIMFGKHLLAASVMAAPGAIVIAKLMMPGSPDIKHTEAEKQEVGDNVLDALTNGTLQGVKMAVNVGAMLIVFLAFIYMINFIFTKTGEWTTINNGIEHLTNGEYKELSLQTILGFILYPVIWLSGVPTPDVFHVASLVGEKMVANEFIAYLRLSELKEQGVIANEKSIIMASYMLCGFANFGSIGMQIGGIGSLAPGQRKVIIKYGLRAMLGGTMASLLSASIVGLLL